MTAELRCSKRFFFSFFIHFTKLSKIVFDALFVKVLTSNKKEFLVRKGGVAASFDLLFTWNWCRTEWQIDKSLNSSLTDNFILFLQCLLLKFLRIYPEKPFKDLIIKVSRRRRLKLLTNRPEDKNLSKNFATTQISKVKNLN